MKRLVIILLSVLLVMSMCFAFTGCKEQSKIVGVWEGTESTDLEAAKKFLGEDEETKALFDYMEFDEYEIDVTYTFNADGTCSMKADEDAAKAIFEEIVSAMLEGMEAYLQDTAAASSMTLDQIAQLMGAASFDALMDSMKDQLGEQAEDLMKIERKGTYTLSGDKLTITDEDTDEAEKCSILELTDSVLNFSMQEGTSKVTLTKKK